MKTLITSIYLFVSIIGFAQNGQKTVDETIDFLRNQSNMAYFEVTSEMFQMLSQSPEVSPEFKNYISKLSTLRMVQTRSNPDIQKFKLYEAFLLNANLKEFSNLMISEEPNNKFSFYKRKNTKSDNEFLLVSSESVILIEGQLDMKSLSEFEQIMEIAGSAFDM